MNNDKIDDIETNNKKYMKFINYLIANAHLDTPVSKSGRFKRKPLEQILKKDIESKPE